MFNANLNLFVYHVFTKWPQGCLINYVQYYTNIVVLLPIFLLKQFTVCNCHVEIIIFKGLIT